MGKRSELTKYQGLITEDGIAYLRYYMTDMRDIIHPFSGQNEEMLSAGFLAFLERYRDVIPAKAPIVLEISGITLTAKEKELIDDTVWAYLCMNMTNADIKARACVKRSLMYLLYTALSAVLLFAANHMTREVAINLAYLPFWFFGYRLLIYLLLDSMPLWRERNRLRRLASMKLFFRGDGKPASEDTAKLEDSTVEEITEDVGEYMRQTDRKLISNYATLNDIKAKGKVELKCVLTSVEDAVQMPGLKGGEMMSDALADFVGRTECFLNPQCSISLEIRGKEFTQSERSRIQNAVKNYYGFRMAAEEKAILNNRQQILLFTVSILISALILSLWGSLMDVARHELIMMLFWFFGDYLLEFILITRFELSHKRKILKKCRDMRLIFIGER